MLEHTSISIIVVDDQSLHFIYSILHFRYLFVECYDFRPKNATFVREYLINGLKQLTLISHHFPHRLNIKHPD